MKDIDLICQSLGIFIRLWINEVINLNRSVQGLHVKLSSACGNYASMINGNLKFRLLNLRNLYICSIASVKVPIKAAITNLMIVNDNQIMTS